MSVFIKVSHTTDSENTAASAFLVDFGGSFRTLQKKNVSLVQFDLYCTDSMAALNLQQEY